MSNNSKYKALKAIGIITSIFVLVWIVDLLSVEFDPNYEPFMVFLKVLKGLLEVTL